MSSATIPVVEETVFEALWPYKRQGKKQNKRGLERDFGEPKISEETSRAKQSINTEKKYTERRGERQKGIRDQPCHHLHPCTKKNQPKTEPRTEKDRACESKTKKEKQTERAGTDTDEKGKTEEIT